MARNHVLDRYLDVCASVEREFERNRHLHGSRIQCRAGCSDCCHQLFQITEIEVEWIAAGVRELPESTRRELALRASQYLDERARIFAGREAWGSLAPGTRLACPALSPSGVCEIYHWRPLICRRFGMPIFNPDKPDRILACELNFKAGEEIDDGQLIQIQTAIHQEWKGVQRAYNDAGGHRDPEPLSVARAILLAAPEAEPPR